MISAWLQQQDNVSQKGVPSWNVLRAALKKIGENEMADKIVSEVAKLKEKDLSSDIATSTMLSKCSSDAKIQCMVPGPVVSVSSTELPVVLPSLLPTAAAGVSGDLSRTLGEIVMRNSHYPCDYLLTFIVGSQ